MNSIGISLTTLFCVAVLALPRRWAVLAFVSSVLYVTQGQAMEIAGINFMAIRFVTLCVFLRVWIRGELPARPLAPTDKWLMLTLSLYVVVSSLRTGKLGAYDLGLLVDGLLVFFAFRGLISTPMALERLLLDMVPLLIPFAVLMIRECITGSNLFAIMGGVSEQSVYRDGYYRARCSFRHSITAGTLGATFMPLYTGLLFHKGHRWVGMTGMTCCVSIVIASQSSGPLMTFLVSILAWCCWPLRLRLKLVRRMLVAGVLCLDVAMKAPVWYMFDRISGVLGGTGWHRANLIDKFLKNFGDWWILGMDSERTMYWAATRMSWGGIDVTNYYVSLGLSGGLVTLLSFFVLLTMCFKVAGRALTAIRLRLGDCSSQEMLLWSLGISIVAHAVNLTSVTYYDQSYAIWYLHLAAVTSVATYWHRIGDPNEKSKSGLPASEDAALSCFG